VSHAKRDKEIKPGEQGEAQTSRGPKNAVIHLIHAYVLLQIIFYTQWTECTIEQIV